MFDDAFWIAMGIVAGTILALAAGFGLVFALILWPLYVGPVVALILIAVVLNGIRLARRGAATWASK